MNGTIRFFAKQRLVFSYVMALLAVAFAPASMLHAEARLISGLLLVAAGIGVRFWAAGHIIKRHKLSDSGPYAFTRNPLYLGSFLAALGMFILDWNMWLLLMFLLGFALFYGSTIRSEEAYLSGKYGEEFSSYMKNVPSFFPRLLPYTTVRNYGFSWGRAFQNREHKSSVVTLLLLAAMFAVGHLRG